MHDLELELLQPHATWHQVISFCILRTSHTLRIFVQTLHIFVQTFIYL